MLTSFARRRKLVRSFVHSRFFDILMGLVITVNAIMLGVEQTYALQGQPTAMLNKVEEVILCVYLSELALRFFAEGYHCLLCHWVKFDLFLALVGVANVWMFKLVQADTSQFGSLMMLRMLRLGRLARTVRLLVKFKVLWMLVRGLLSSAGTMFYVFVLLSIILYIFSAMAVELITNHPLAHTDEEFARVVEENFATLPDTMLTLVQFLCMDSIGAIYKPLIQKDYFLVVYFTLVILVVPIVLMNLVTAIIVNSAMEQASSDREVEALYEKEKRARMIKNLQEVFIHLDTDNSGQVSRDEIGMIEEVDRFVLQQATTLRDPMEVFNALNVDGAEALSIDEFCDGIWKLATSKASIEVQRTEKQVGVMFDRVKLVSQNQRATERKLDQLLQGQALMQSSLIKIQSQLAWQQQLPASVAGSSPPSPTIDLSLSGRQLRRTFGDVPLIGTPSDVSISSEALPCPALFKASSEGTGIANSIDVASASSVGPPLAGTGKSRCLPVGMDTASLCAPDGFVVDVFKINGRCVANRPAPQWSTSFRLDPVVEAPKDMPMEDEASVPTSFRPVSQRPTRLRLDPLVEAPTDMTMEDEESLPTSLTPNFLFGHALFAVPELAAASQHVG